jgi:REP element-mobilizing transposase RayT
MSRPLRLEFAGALYHVTARGNAREDIFRDDGDRATFLDLLGREIAQQRWRLYAYCLMGNHYHLLIETPEPNLTRGMQRLNQIYTQRFNRRHRRVGHVLQGRYKAIVVDKDSYFKELIRYVVLNPVRAKMVRLPERWAWSSYRATAGLSTVPLWLAVDEVRGQFGGRGAVYRRFVAQGIGLPSVWEGLRGQMWLGDETFRDRMQRRLGGKRSADVSRAQREPARPNPDELLAEVAKAFDLPRHAVLDRRHAQAYRCAVYLLRRVVNEPIAKVARRAGISAPRVSQIQAEAESARPQGPMRMLLDCYKVKR